MTTLYDSYQRMHQALLDVAEMEGVEVRDFSFTIAKGGLTMKVSQLHEEGGGVETRALQAARDRDAAYFPDHVLKVRPSGKPMEPYLVVEPPISCKLVGGCDIEQMVHNKKVAFVNLFGGETIERWSPSDYGDYIITMKDGNIIVGEMVRSIHE